MKKQSEIFNRTIVDQETWNFTAPADGVYAIIVLARCKNWRQNARRLFNDDDLGVWLDNYPFAELGGKKREFAAIGSWNGNKLANKEKAVVFVLSLRADEHQLRFWADGAPYLQSIEIYQPGLGEQDMQLPLPSGVAAADIVFKNVPLAGLTAIGRDGAVKNYEVASDWLGVRAWELQRPGQPPLASVKIKLGQKAVRYKIGRVKLYQNISLSAEVNLRALPNEEAPILSRLSDGAALEIITERVDGEYIRDRSDIWHEVIWQDERGFILSSFVEIEGQERERIIELIKAKCRERKVDANVMLAIAQRESHFKPYAVAYDQYKQEAQGVFQLRKDAAQHMGVIDRFDVFQNIDGGVRYYKWLEAQFTGRGNVLEKRLVAWHDGLGHVPKNGPLDYGKLSPAVKEFLKTVLANYKKRDWKNIIFVPAMILLSLTGYASGQLIVKNNAPPLVVDAPLAQDFQPGKVAGAAAIAAMIPTGRNIVVNNNYELESEGIKRIIVRELRGENEWPYTELVYWSDRGEFREILDGYFEDAGWRDGFFTVARGEGKYTDVSFYLPRNGLLQKIKFIDKNGRTRADMSRFDFLPNRPGAVLRELVGDTGQFSPIDPNKTYVREFREYEYDFLEDVFREARAIKDYYKMPPG